VATSTLPQKPFHRLNFGEGIDIVIWVHSGVVYAVEAHRDKKTAQARKRFFKKGNNLDYDEVGVFEVKIGKPDDI